MSYTIKTTNGNILTTVPDTQIVSNYGGLSLLGKNYSGFGTSLNTDLVRMTEHFANSTAPANPFIGQIWYDTVSNIIKFWNGTIFKPVSVITSADTAPLNPTDGDEWYDILNDQLYVWNGVSWILIGPPSSESAGKEGFVILPAIATANGNVTCVEWYANNTLLGVLSSVDLINPGIGGFSNIRTGFNFVTEPTLGIFESGIYGSSEITLGDNDQIAIYPDENDNFVLAVENGNVILATNGNNLVTGELSTLTGNVYLNNLICKGLTFPLPGSTNEFLFNDHGNLNASPVLILDSAEQNIVIQTNLTANNIIVNSNISSPNLSSTKIITANLINVSNIVSTGTIKANIIESNILLEADSACNVQGVTSLNGPTYINNSANIVGNLNLNYGTTNAFSMPTSKGTAAGGALLTNALGGTFWGDANQSLWDNKLLASNGYQTLPSGLIIQWAHGTTYVNGRGQYTITWPITFPTLFFGAIISPEFYQIVGGGNWQGVNFYVEPNSTTSILKLQYDVRSDGSADSSYRPFAIGIGI